MMTGFYFSALTVVFWCTIIGQVSDASWERSNVVLKDNGYNGVVIAIHNSVAEDERILQRLQIIFEEASQFLFRATNRRAFFRDVTILVPRSWSDSPKYGQSKKESFEKASIIVDRENQLYGDNPYVKQMGGCGTKGEYLHLTPHYIIDEEASRRQWGPTDRLLVHEWTHLRWGVFDEYPINGYSSFYVASSGKVEATRCSLQLHGRHKNKKSGEECKYDNTTGLPEPNCRFIPDSDNTATGSLMYMQFLPSVTGFCHSNSSDPAAFHNREAPNRQNQLCAGMSTWDVMLKSEDFADGRNPPIPEDVVINTKPAFRFVRSGARRIVMVLDRSGSMEGTRLAKLRQAASSFIRKTVDDGSYLGIVQFSDFAEELASMTLIADEQSRESLVARLPSTVGGWTSIGGAILKGLEVLRAGGLDPSGAVILLISDGGENRSPTIPEVEDVIEDAGVIIDTIAYSEQADENLASLAASTGGMSFFYSGDEDSTVLDDAFATTVTSRRSETDDGNLAVKLWSGVVSIGARDEASGHVYIDSTVGGKTEFTFTYSESRVEVVIQRPDGSIIDQHYIGYAVDEHFKRVVVSLNETSQPGKWIFNVTNLFFIPQVVTVSVNSHASNRESEPIKVTSKLSNTEIDFRISPLITIFADVTKSYLPVIGVSVTAVTDRPPLVVGEAGTKVTLQLLDNGAGADVEKNDGIYSAHFLDFTADGHYGVRVTANNEHGEARIALVPVDQQSLPVVPANSTGESNVTYEAVDPFNRVVAGGSFQLSNYQRFGSEEEMENHSKEPDVYEPSRIKDLAIVAVSRETRDVTLQWTAPGDDLDRGTVSWYDVRVSETFSELYDDFGNAVPLNSSHVVEGDILSPKPSGSLEVLVVRLPMSVSTLKFMIAVRAVDDVGNIAEPSNVVSGNFERVPTTTVSGVTQQGSTAHAENITMRDQAQEIAETETNELEDTLLAPPPSSLPTADGNERKLPTTATTVKSSATVGSLKYSLETWKFWTVIGCGFLAMIAIISFVIVFARVREQKYRKKRSYNMDQISNPIVIDDILKGEEPL